MEIKFHKRHWRVNTIVERVVFTARPNPGKVCLLQVDFEVFETMLKNCVRIVSIKGFEQVDDLLLLTRSEQLDRATLCMRT